MSYSKRQRTLASSVMPIVSAGGVATEPRRKGLSKLDIAELGRWSSTEMIQRYSMAYTFQDAATRYKAVVR